MTPNILARAESRCTWEPARALVNSGLSIVVPLNGSTIQLAYAAPPSRYADDDTRFCSQDFVILLESPDMSIRRRMDALDMAAVAERCVMA